MYQQETEIMRQATLWAFSTVLSISFLASSAFAKGNNGAGIYLDETFFPAYVNTTETSGFPTATASPKSGIGLDSRTTLGFVFENGLFAGATYNMYSLTAKRDYVAGASAATANSGNEEATTRNEMGPTFGYMSNGWKVLFTYFLSGNKDYTSTDSDETGVIGKYAIKDTKGSGFQLAFGYNFALGSHFEIGPSIIYRNVSYTTESRTDGAANTPTYTDVDTKTPAGNGNLDCMISMGFKF
jgi:hypothetical protein